MTKETIIEDSITYIKELQTNVNILQEQLFEMEASAQEAPEPRKEEVDAAELMKKFGIQVYILTAWPANDSAHVYLLSLEYRNSYACIVYNFYYCCWCAQIGVDVAQIDGNKLWVKAILEKKRGGFTKLVEAMTYFGFELTDTNVTTSNGAMVVSSILTVSLWKTRSETKYIYSVVMLIESKYKYCSHWWIYFGRKAPQYFIYLTDNN